MNSTATEIRVMQQAEMLESVKLHFANQLPKPITPEDVFDAVTFIT